MTRSERRARLLEFGGNAAGLALMPPSEWEDDEEDANDEE